MAEPVKVSAGTVMFDPGLDPPIVENAPALVPALLPETVATVAVLFVPAGVPADVAEVVALVPVNVGVEIVPAGVTVALPPVVPTSPLAATVPRSILPFRAATSVQPEGHVPVTTKVISPEGNVVPPPPIFGLAGHRLFEPQM
jgi:hypothetical protein